MSTLRDHYPRAHLPHSHIFLTISHGERIKTWAVRPLFLYAALTFGPMLGIAGLSFGGVMALKSPEFSSRISAGQDSAYEARLRTMSEELGEAQSRALVAKVTLESKLRDLMTRQAQVEARQTIVANLTEAALPAKEIRTVHVRDKALLENPAQNPLIVGTGTFGTQKGNTGFSETISSYLPNNRPVPLPDNEANTKLAPAASAHPLGPQGALEEIKSAQMARLEPVLGETSTFEVLERTAAKIELHENQQIVALEALGNAADKNLNVQKQAIANAGLSLEKLSASGSKNEAAGGPFVPLNVNPNGSSFERAVYRAQSIIETAARLKRIMPYVPLRHPLAGDAEITSTFGGRIDPFNGQMAMHTGVDFRLEYGAPVHPTAAGTVISAGPNGGYGNMVDVDHGNGLVTRYGHLSAVLVREGDKVTPASTIGKLGSTGRSTGPHLHYEVRINDEAVNPLRFLKAGEPLYASR